MRTRLLIVAVCLLAVTSGPAPAQGSSSRKPAAPTEVGGKTLDQWLQATRSQDPSVRETALRAIPYFGEAARAAAPQLTARVEDPDAACRVYAALALSYLAGALTGDDAAKAIKVLADKADNDPQAVVRLYAVGALGSFGDRATAAIPSLVNRIHDGSSWELRQGVVNSLASIAYDKKFGPDARAVTAIAKLLSGEEKSARVRTAAAMALGNMGTPHGDAEFKLAMQALLKASRDPDKGVAIWAQVALMSLDKERLTEEALSDVARYLKVKDVMLKVTAARALEALGREAAASRVPDLIELLHDHDPLVIATAIDVLTAFGPTAKAAVPDLERMVASKDEREYFRRAAHAALEKITGNKQQPLPDIRRPDPGSSAAKAPDPTEVGGKTLAQWKDELKNPDPGVREGAIQMIPYFGKSARSAAPALTARLRDPDVACKVHAAIALSAIAEHVSGDDAAEAVKGLAERADTDGQAIVRFQAAQALGSFSTKGNSAIPGLANRVHDTASWEVRLAAVNSLASLGGLDSKLGPDPRAVTALANRLLSDEEKSGEVRMGAVMGLGAMGRPVSDREFKLAVQALLKASKDHDPKVAIWAAVALMAVDKVTKEGLDAVAKHFKGKDVMAKVTAARALEAMGKEARPKIPDVIALLGDGDPLVVATAIDVLAGFGDYANDAVPALKKLIDKKDQTDYFKRAAQYAIEQIEGKRKK
jgi:hypothetical protein